MAGDQLPGQVPALPGVVPLREWLLQSGLHPVRARPWAAPELADAGTVHVGGTREELARSENEVAAGTAPGAPLCAGGPALTVRRRPGAGRAAHPLGYCHVPAGSTRDMGEAVTAQLERFAPGFRDLVVSTR